jgi:uncharacterized protein YjaG (DUF416 family)
MLRYDEQRLTDALARATAQGRRLFAVRAAERLFALYEDFAARAKRGDPAVLRQALDAAWDAVADDAPSEELERWQGIAESLVPDEEDDGWVAEQAYGENAAAAVAYSLRARIGDDPKEAGWAGLQVYEAADYAAQRQLEELDLNQPGAEDELAARPVVQEALQAIDDDLAAALAAGPALDDIAAHKREAREGGRRLAALVRDRGA